MPVIDESGTQRCDIYNNDDSSSSFIDDSSDYEERASKD